MSTKSIKLRSETESIGLSLKVPLCLFFFILHADKISCEIQHSYSRIILYFQCDAKIYVCLDFGRVKMENVVHLFALKATYILLSLF